MRTLLLFAALAPLGAVAAPPPPQADTSQGELDTSGPYDVVVTASRRQMSAAEAPASISRIDGEDFALVGAKHQADILNAVPGVYVQRGSGSESLAAIRSPVLAGAGACGAFLVTEDSLPIRPVGFCNLNEMFELNYEQSDHVEILRGPGSALFGASAVHGVINAITPDPAFMPQLFLGAETGSDAFKRLSLGAGHVFDGPSNSSVGMYGVATRAPGWRDASGVDELKLNLLGDSQVFGGSLRLRAAGSVLNQETAGFIQGFDSYRDESVARTNPNPEAFRDASSARVAAHFDKHDVFGANSELELAGIYRRSRMDFLQHFLIGKPLEHNAQTSYMASAAATLTRGSLVTRLAVDAETAATELTEFQPRPATDGAPAANAIRPAGFHYDYGVDSRTFGATVSADYAFADYWHASAALRADTTNYDYDNHMLAGNTDEDGVPCGATGCLYARPADRSDTFDNLSPRVTLAWDFRRNNVYATASTGFRPPEMTELYRLQRQQSVADLDSEQMDSYEIGWKSRYLGYLDFDLAFFYMEKRNVILRESNGFNVGDGSTSHRGVEYDALYRVDPGTGSLHVELRFSGTVARHEYEFSRAVEGGESIVSGNDVDTAPRNLHSVDLSASFGDANAWKTGVTWRHVGSYFLDAANTAKYPGHKVADLRLQHRTPGGLGLTVRVDNLFDTSYADRADFAFGNYRYFPARGRAAFLSVDYLVD
ncbi:MAG TPA: TonB-dependent receptor [Steroidobacteraceae bacterium]|nr:TonB-dependent receptor [Steroidobacteraceae bacterium]